MSAPGPISKEPDKITVHLGTRTYDILVSSGGLEEFGRTLRDYRIGHKGAMVFTSPRIGRLYFKKLKRSLEGAGFTAARHDIPDGERGKSLRQYQSCIDALMEAFPDPADVPIVVNLGGGVVGDTGGFAAGTFRRGVPCVQVPTTVLGCVDCGVGGKVGVNHRRVKNVVGMFYQPRLVFADLALLRSLPGREIRSGVAEVIKYAAVCKRELFGVLEDGIERLVALEPGILRHVVGECYRIKASVVEEDERDNLGRRAVLNYGHTIGHALELAAEPRMTHGEAVSIGMLGAARLAIESGVGTRDLHDRLRRLIERAGLPTSAGAYKVEIARVMKNLRHDKKSANGKLRFVLPTGLGRWRMDAISDDRLVRKIVESCLR